VNGQVAGVIRVSVPFRVVTVMRYDGPAMIRQDEQEVAAECVFTVRPPGDGKGSWYGRFTEGQGRLATGEAVLVLPNGESGP
jgi:hypothetical protein